MRKYENQDNSFSVLSPNMNRSKRLLGGKTFYYIRWHLETTSNMNSSLKWRALELFLWKHETCDQIMVKWQDWKVRFKYSLEWWYLGDTTILLYSAMQRACRKNGSQAVTLVLPGNSHVTSRKSLNYLSFSELRYYENWELGLLVFTSPYCFDEQNNM